MKTVPQNIIIVLALIIVVIVIIAVSDQFTKTETISMSRQKIYPYSLDNPKPLAIPVKISDIKPNGVVYFMYPPGLSPLGDDNHFQKFMLIRLPVWLGGTKNDISAFRAYSAVDLASHCQLKYWPDYPDRQIEDPCTSPDYRVIDGVSVYYPQSKLIRAPSTGALPKLDLSVDKEDYINVEPPIFTPEKNGVIGYGREVSEDEVKRGTEFVEMMKNTLEEKMSSFYLPKQLDTDHKLLSVSDNGMARIAVYGTKDEPEDWMNISFEFCNCTKTYKQVLETEGKHFYGEFWKINGVDIYGVPNRVDARKNLYSLYTFTFYLDGFRVVFQTNLAFDDGMSLVLKNYFPGTRLEGVSKIET